MRKILMAILFFSLLGVPIWGCSDQVTVARESGDADEASDVDGASDADIAHDSEAETPVDPETTRILVVMDQSNSLNCTDTDYRRLELVNEIFEEIPDDPAVTVGYVGFNTALFVEPFGTAKATLALIDPYSRQQGPASDYQGVLSELYRIIESDIETLSEDDRATTAYVIHFVSDGSPEPTCSEGCDDTELFGICNSFGVVPEGEYVDFFDGCASYNTHENIFEKIENLNDLISAESILKLVFNTYFLSPNQDIVEARCPGGFYTLACVDGLNLLSQMADLGGGTFVNRMEGECDAEYPTGTHVGPPYECDNRLGTCGTPEHPK